MNRPTIASVAMLAALSSSAAAQQSIPDLICTSVTSFSASYYDGTFNAFEFDHDYTDIHSIRADSLFFHWTEERRRVARAAGRTWAMPDVEFQGLLQETAQSRIAVQIPPRGAGFDGTVWVFSDDYRQATRFLLAALGETNAEVLNCIRRE